MMFEKIREIICDQLELEEDQVTMDSILLEDLGADSIDLADLVMTFEDEFDIEIDEELVTPENFQTVNLIVAMVKNILADNSDSELSALFLVLLCNQGDIFTVTCLKT